MLTKIKLLLKIIFDAVRKIIKLEKLLNLTKLNGKLSIFKLFFLNTICILLKNNFNKKKINNNISISNYGEINFIEVTKNLEEDGCSKIYNLESQKINNIKNEIFENEFESSLVEAKKAMIKEKKTRSSFPIKIEKSPTLKKIIFSNQFIEFSKIFLKTDKITLSASLSYSIYGNTSNREKIREAQFFHYDIDYKNQFKFFIYLNDVGLENGPHQYATKSHKKKNGMLILNRPFPDKMITDSYNIKSYEGKSNSCFFIDGFGYHRGLPPINERLVIGIDFGSDFIKYYENDYFYKV